MKELNRRWLKSLNARNWNVTNIFWITLVHLLALAAIPYFSWGGLGLALGGLFLLAPLGINVGYHRMLTHKSFVAPPFVRNALVTIGALIGAGPPIHWAAMHRVHHRFSDTKQDPHNSNLGFWYSHVLHLFVLDEKEEEVDYLSLYAPDLMKEPYLVFLNRYGIWLAVAMLPLLYLAGGIGWVLWGAFVRTALTWHIMWFVNSASHKWGYRNYDTNDLTTNCWWVGLLAAGEGWHNNHHAVPNSAAHGHRRWEIDQSFAIIRVLEVLGLATEVKRPRPIPVPAR